MGSVFDSLLLGSKQPNFQLVHCPCQPMGYKPTTRLGLSTAIWKKKSLKEKKQIEGRSHELSKLGRQHTKAPLAAALSPFMSVLYPPNTRCDWCVKVGHTTGVYVPYSFRKVVWVLLRPQEPNIKVKLLWDGTQGFLSLSEKTRKSIKPFVDVITKAALSSQLFIDPECWSGQGSNAISRISDI